LQGAFLQIELIFRFAHFQLSLALDTHLVFFLFQFEVLLQTIHIVLGLQSLLLQIEASLFHLDFAFLVGIALVFPFIVLVFHFACQGRVGQHKDGVAFL
jgi:hypothetical protein